MSEFMNYLKSESHVTITENGAKQYDTTGSKNLDFFYACGNIVADTSNIVSLFLEAFEESRDLALANLFRMRDIRNGGLGVRSTFKDCLKALANHNFEEFIYVMVSVPFIGRWDDMFPLLDEDVPERVRESVCIFTLSHLYVDLFCEDEGVSLLGKWLPNINSKNALVKKRANYLCKKAGLTPKKYRKIKSILNEKLDVVECKMSRGEFDKIDYSKIPSKALHMYKSSFQNRDGDRFKQFLKDTIKNNKKVKVTGIYPHEILKATMRYNYHPCFLKENNPELANLIELQWKSLERFDEQANTIVVRDGSHSMCGMPEEIATSLSIYFSEQLKGEFKDKFITFSRKPRLVDLSDCKDIFAKLEVCFREREVANTNIMALYKLILNASERITNPEEYIKRIVIISDMQFDYCGEDVVPYDEAKKMFEDKNIPFPEIIFWNVNGEYMDSIPVSPDAESGVKLISGSSINLVKEIVTGVSTSKHEYMLECLEPFMTIVSKAKNPEIFGIFKDRFEVWDTIEELELEFKRFSKVV